MHYRLTSQHFKVPNHKLILKIAETSMKGSNNFVKFTENNLRNYRKDIKVLAGRINLRRSMVEKMGMELREQNVQSRALLNNIKKIDDLIPVIENIRKGMDSIHHEQKNKLLKAEKNTLDTELELKKFVRVTDVPPWLVSNFLDMEKQIQAVLEKLENIVKKLNDSIHKTEEEIQSANAFLQHSDNLKQLALNILKQ